MRTILLGLALALALPASSTWAAIEQIQLSRPSNLGAGGGVFQVTGTLGSFETFCVQLGEYISFGTTYNVDTDDIGTTNDSLPSEKSLGSQAAWLYTKFLSTGVDAISVSTSDEANAMQLGIWQGMGYGAEEIESAMIGHWGSSQAGVQAYISTLQGTILTVWINSDLANYNNWMNNNLIGNVRIMNLFTTSGGRAQDQLIIVTPPDPEPGTVPEPATIAVWSALLGMGLVAAKRRTA